jgi:pyridoxal phosphate enzyme (YggS family)
MLIGPQNYAPMYDESALIRRLHDVRSRLDQAAARCGRNPADIRLVAVSKQHPAEAVRLLADAGQRDFGENYLQEALPKLEALKDLPLTWHYIGQIQSNKTRPIAEHFAWVHTVDRLRIAERLNEQRPHYAAAINVCIQVKLADEPGKAGVSLEEVASLAHAINKLPKLSLRGLMCIPPPAATVTEQRSYFATLARTLVELNSRGLSLDTLSMGMSDDAEAAIAQGATIVRVGTAIFGERKKRMPT